ncbi:putative Aromatic peroxygenase [Sclerotinia borealis F-4128]|uniref:Putative Aromatic peroxygenase n=1 Tax=Sclerotinia borealis (strain F-4128) TaxID=1432307 RepID=W9CWL9_SCLBF|nr:putative Aromatic peroxygenase [Sclerotinia borealis F-4128]
MKVATNIALLAFAATEVAAYPKMAAEHAERLTKSQRGKRSTAARDPLQKRAGFDAASQYVSTTGKHTFVAPNYGAGDVRGPCPGLNAAANHGYIPHNGVGTIGDFIDGTNVAYGMSLDLGGFLGVYGAVFDGNLLAYSIGGPTTNNALPLGNLLGVTGPPQGLSGSHNKYESDTSPTRPDLYLAGQSYDVEVPLFQKYYDALIEGVGADAQYQGLLDFRIDRHNNSKTTNPYFFSSPFAGVLVSPAGYNFPVRMMSNKSAEFPEGSLTKSDLMSFFAITGESGNFQYAPGHERIPDNWYKRATDDEYSIAGFLADVIDYAEQYPPLLDIGGNTGKPNTFTPVDLGSLTKGVFESGTLLEGNNLECFVFQAAQAAIPDIAGGTLTSIGNSIQPFSDTVAQRLLGLGCPKLEGIDQKSFDKFPGYTKCKNGCSSY